MDDVRDQDEADRLVLELITQHAESLLRVARRYSFCADDAQDAYQRAMEILMRHARRLDRPRAAGWLHTVVKHEALAVRAQRSRSVGAEEVDFDRLENRTSPSPEERVLSFERVAQTAEALQRVKPNEAKAMWLKASGVSYAEIAERTGWTYTKVNRCLAEGRRSFLARFAGIESGDECRRWAPALSAIVDGEADAEVVLEARVHLRHCASCQSTVRQLRMANRSLGLLLPVVGTGGALAGSDGVAGPATGVLVRLYESIVSSLGDQAAGGALRVQAIVDAATNHKLAAVAASAAAMAGGGVAVERAVVTERPAIARAAESRTATRTPASSSTASSTTGSPTIPATSTAAAPTTTTAAPTRSERPTAPRTAPDPSPPEPLVDPVGSQATAQAAATPSSPATATRTTPSPSPSPHPTQPSAQDEFGFESR